MKMAYGGGMGYHLHMPSYFWRTFTEYPYCVRRHSKHYPCPYAACAVSTHPQFKRNTLWPLNFSLAVGCLHTDYEKYEVIDGVRVRRGTETKNWWGPVNAGVTLVWKIYYSSFAS